MGVLNSAFGGSAANAAGASMNFGVAGTAATGAGAVLSGIGGAQQYGYQSAVAATNANIAQTNARAALDAGQYEESASKLRTGELIGAQKAAQGANGVDVNVGSTVATRDTSAEISALDAAMIHYNAAKSAYGYRVQAASDHAQANADRLAAVGSIFGGLYKGGSSVLSGATNLASKWAAYQLNFPKAGGGSSGDPAIGAGGVY